MTPGNYSVHFREWVEANAQDFIDPQLGKAMAAIATELRRAEHFILPDSGKIVGMDNMPEDTSNLLRPPFPVTAIEFAVSGDPGEMERSSRRIVLVHELPGKTGILVTPIAYWDREDCWMAAVTALLAYDRWWDPAVKGIRAEPVAIGGIKSEPARLFDDCMLDVRAYIEMCLALSCSNVSTDKIAAPPKLNAKRSRSGKPAFRDYHFLTIPGTSRTGGLSLATGRTVRTHLRRGHIRRLPTHQVWVNATVVKGGTNGFVSKDYRVAC